MDAEAFRQFAVLEREHWWFVGRRGLYLPLLEHVLRRAGALDRGPLEVVDVGCGVGGFLEALGAFGRVRGLELDEQAAGISAERAPTGVALSDQLPLADGSVDLLTLWDVIEHTPDDDAVMAAVARSLAPGGHVALSVPAYQFLYANNDRVAHHQRRYVRGRLVELLRGAGLEVAKATYVNVTLSPLIIPAVLAIKLKERLVPVSDDDTTNLSWSLPGPVNRALGAIFAGERHWLRHVNAPFGHSLFAVGRKPAP